MEKTRPKASFCFKGTTADHKIEEKSNDNNQKKALKIKQNIKYMVGIEEQKSGVILTSMEPNIFRMLFSIKKQKLMC